MAYNTKKYLDEEGLKQVVRLLDEYPDNQILGTVIDEIQSELDKKADVVDIPEVPVQDVQVDGISVLNNGVASIGAATADKAGVVIANPKYGTYITNRHIVIQPQQDSTIKSGTWPYGAITPETQHKSTFYGLAKAAGHDEKDSALSLGTYTPEAKGAIQKMLGVSDLIATEENNLIASKAYAVGDVFTANGKLYKATAAIAQDAAIIVDGANANCEETKVGEGFVKFTDYADGGKPGIVQLYNQYGITKSGGYPTTLQIHAASEAELKAGIHSYRPVVPLHNHEATFYGLSKVAGVDLANTTVTLGIYPDNAKTAIRNMLGATSSNVIAIQDTQPTDSDTKIWLPETAETPVEVPTVAEMEQALAGKVGDVKIDGSSIVNNNIANIPLMTDNIAGVAKRGSGLYVNSNGQLCANIGNASTIKQGTATTAIAPISLQSNTVFYGLATAAGDTTQSVSENAVGTYTDNAKTAIRTMIGAVGDVQVNGTSVVANGIANTPLASRSQVGVMQIGNGFYIDSNNPHILNVDLASSDQIKYGDGNSSVRASQIHLISFYGLAKAAGDTTQRASSNAVGTYTDEAKLAIQNMLGVPGSVDVTISGTDPIVTAVANHRYICGEVYTLDFTPSSTGICDVIFTSGSTAAVLTLPSTVRMPEWFDITTLETDTIYEINIVDGVYGAVMSWPVV